MRHCFEEIDASKTYYFGVASPKTRFTIEKVGTSLSEKSFKWDKENYDVFIGRVEVCGIGYFPITEGLISAPEERIAFVVPHEGFHLQVQDLREARKNIMLEEAMADIVGVDQACHIMKEYYGESSFHYKQALKLKGDYSIITKFFKELAETLNHGFLSCETEGEKLKTKKEILKKAKLQQIRLLQETDGWCKDVLNRPLNNASIAHIYRYAAFHGLVEDVYDHHSFNESMEIFRETLRRAKTQGLEAGVNTLLENSSGINTKADYGNAINVYEGLKN